MYYSYIKKLFICTFIFIVLILSFNYIIDPYGYNSRDNKFVKNLSMTNKPQVVNARLNSIGYYYLIGTSRMARVNPKTIESLTGKRTHNIKINGSTLRENKLLANAVKSRGKHFIYGFDAFSLNISRNTHQEIKNRYLTYKKELNKGNFFTYYFNNDITVRSFQHIAKKLKGTSFNSKYMQENNVISTYSLENAAKHAGLKNIQKKKNFSNFKRYSDKDIIGLAKLGDKNDIFIIFPQHSYYYMLFAKYQNIEKQYFEAIKLLVKNTNAKVWSFYGYNYITNNKNNFDKNGWHFKPKISKLIFQKILKNTQNNIKDDFGVLLTKDNVDAYLKTLHVEIQRFTP